MKHGYSGVVRTGPDGRASVVERNVSVSAVSLILAATRHGVGTLRPVGGWCPGEMHVDDEWGNTFRFE